MIADCFRSIQGISILAIGFICLEAVHPLAFCKQKSVIDEYGMSYFPLRNPERHIPWVWDAYLEDGIVEVISIPAKSCSFNTTLWKSLIGRYPEYSSQLADGLFSNILVSVDEPNLFDYAGVYNHDQGLLNIVVMCHFYSNDHLVYSTSSLRIRGEIPHSSIGSIQIRCPAPPSNVSSWNLLKLERPRSLPMATQLVGSIVKPVKISSYETEKFPVCNSPSSLYDEFPSYEAHGARRSQKGAENEEQHQHKYNMSICSATARSNRQELVEWIEYHRLVGVSHFFLYDTAFSPADRGRLAAALSDYVRQGLVTIEEWPYENCVRHMASGRPVWWYEELAPTTHIIFQPPRAIAQTAALSSCFTRYRRTSKYMLHVDDDEFFMFTHGKNPLWGRRARSLVDVADEIFRRHPRAPAIRVAPMDKFNCPSMEEAAARIRKSLSGSPAGLNIFLPHLGGGTVVVPAVLKAPADYAPPRVGRWQYSFRGEGANSKMIMRTDAVIAFFVHYLTLVEEGFRVADVVTPRRRLMAIWHYKTPWEISGNIFGHKIPFQAANESFLCGDRRLGLVYDGWAFAERNTSSSKTRGGVAEGDGGPQGNNEQTNFDPAVAKMDPTPSSVGLYLPPHLMRCLERAFNRRMASSLSSSRAPPSATTHTSTI